MRPLLILILASFGLLPKAPAKPPGESGLALAAKQPNFVIFLADDQGWGDLSLHGNNNLSTPHIDSLARDGAQFDRFFVCAVCAPTRAEFLTGRYYPRTGVRGVSIGEERLNSDEVTIADTFKKAGYATGAFGKWHNGSQHPYHPNARGFDEYRGFTSGHWGHYFDSLLEHNGELIKGEGYLPDYLTTHAIEFIEQNKEKPFFCYLPYNIPHSPMQVPDEYWQRHATKELAMRHRDPEREDPPHLRAALAMCENIDANVGRVLKTLEELQLAENTIVLYFSDNGPNGWRWNGGMKGRKGTIDEGGLRVPCLVRWPAKIKPGTRIEEIAGAIDLLPTLTDLAGIPKISTKPIDGLSLKPFLFGEKVAWPDRVLISIRRGRRQQGPQVSVRSQQHRLDPGGKLFDLSADPGQRHDVAADHTALVKDMKSDARKFVAEVQDKIGPDPRPFPIGGAAITHLPARDGVAHGGVKRSARAPNCSYFTNWTGTEDKITWQAEVLEAGDYEVEIYYSCPEKDVGATFEISMNEAKLESLVSVAHDPPLRGAESDRTPNRGSESYVRDWRPLKAGTLSLKKGRGAFTLRALKIPGEQVMEVRLVILRRK